jgi:C-terminal processing protease CtpA/Prc
VRKFDGSEQQMTLQRPVRALQSPVSSKLEGGGGSERVGVIRLTSFNARAQVGLPACLPACGFELACLLAVLPQPAAMLSPPSSLAPSSLQRDTLAAVQRLQTAGAQRLVLDLRDNRGGLVSEGIEVARLFLDDNALVVRTEGKAKASAAPIIAAGPAATAGGRACMQGVWQRWVGLARLF